jgi:hypothetical protein
MLQPQLSDELDNLGKQFSMKIVEEPLVINLIIEAFPTSSLYNPSTTNLLLRIPRSYPDAGLDMFWTDEAVVLADGTIPNGATSIETYAGLDVLPQFKNKRWRRFSWHVGNPTKWNPSLDNIESYLEFIRKRFSQR